MKKLVLFSFENYVQSGFHPSTFYYYCFSFEIEFKIQLGVWGEHCILWLKQYSDLLKPLEMTLSSGCDKYYSYCIITSNSCSHMLLSSWGNPLQSALLFTTPLGHASAMQLYAIFDCFSEKNYGNKTIGAKIVCENLLYVWMSGG